MFREAAKKYAVSYYTLEKEENIYKGKAYPDVWQEAQELASGLLEIGIKPDNKISILAEGRSSWVVSEFSILFCKAIAVPLSVKLLPDEILFRIQHSESKAIFVSQNHIEKVISVFNKLADEKFKMICFDNNTKIRDLSKKNNLEENILFYDELLEQGKLNLEKNKVQLQKLENEIQEDDAVTISYTSGTTGNPKGIILTHLNYFSNSRDAMLFFDVKEKEKLFVILPIDHSFAHTVGIFASLVRGISIYFLDASGGTRAAIKNIPINLKEANANFMLTVPALSGNFMQKIIEGIEAKGGWIEKLFKNGLSAGIEKNNNGYQKKKINIKKQLNYFLAKKILFKKIRKIFGNEMKYCVGGGALLDVSQQRFFYSLGVPVFQGYGLSEAAPIISTNTPKVHKLGTSGKILQSIECKILNSDGVEVEKGKRGEIVIKGDNVMKGYFKNPKATAETIKNNWLYTGDLGYIDEDDFLVVVGREKALLISEDGEKYSPEEIEEAIVNCGDLINQVMIYNDHKRYTSALITLNEGRIERLIKKNKIENPNDLLKEIQLSFYNFKQQEDFKDKFSEKWIPSIFRIIKEPFSEQNKMINSTMKMVRHVITEIYFEEINSMYMGECSKTHCPGNTDLLEKMFFNK